LLMLARFAPHMGTDQPVFGFRPRWIDGHGEAYSSVNEAAGEFLAELRAVQPSGPYALGGYCVGGVIALEMARQLIQSGEKVSLLALLDCERPTAYRALLADFRLSFRRAIHMGDVIRGILIPNGRSRVEMIRELARRKTAIAGPTEAEASADYRFFKNVIAYRRLGYSHRVAEYPGNIMLLVNNQQSFLDKYMGWKNVARGGLDVHTVPGDHLTVLTVYGRQFGELLRKSLDEVLQQHRSEIAV
jgi:thioesterase domain-containing protein